MASPMPVPSYCERGCSRWKMTKIRSAYSASIPIPLSETRNFQHSPSRTAESSARGAASPRNLIAFPIRFWNTTRSSDASPMTVGSSPSTTISAPLSSITRPRSARTRSTSAAQSTAVCGCSIRPTRENASRSLMRSCMRCAPSTAKPMYWSARASSSPAVALLEQLAERRDLAQRLLQVVGGDVRELLELLVGAPQVGLRGLQRGELGHDPRAHRLDVLGQLDHLGRAVAGDLALVVAARDLAHAPRERLQREHDLLAAACGRRARG